MAQQPSLRGRRAVVAAAATLVCCLALVLGALAFTREGGQPHPSTTSAASPPPATPSNSSSAPEQSPTEGAGEQLLGRSKPVAVRIPAIDLRTRGLVALGLDENRRMEVPKAWDTAGWYTLAPTPGQRGPAVIVGHVDSKSGPAVFYRLHEMHKGDTVKVRRADRVSVTFTVYKVGRYPKNNFPTKAVYGNTPGPELRLITCGGSFNEQSGHYRDNIVVFARMTGASGIVDSR